MQWCCHGWRAIPRWPRRPLRRPRRWEAGAAPPPLLHQAGRGTLTSQQPIQRQVLVILLQCCGSMTFWYWSGLRIHVSDLWIQILLYSSLTFKTPTKNEFKKSFSAYYFMKLHLHHFSKIESQKEVRKQEESRFFLLYLLDDGRIRIRIRTSD